MSGPAPRLRASLPSWRGQPPFCGFFPMPGIHITDIEAAINYWREKKPSPDGVTLAPELRAGRGLCARWFSTMRTRPTKSPSRPRHSPAWRAWYDTTADTPCIAICSTSQGDALCKGCGRSLDEVQHWPEMTPGEKRGTWRRITQEATARRFGRYADRALGGMSAGPRLTKRPDFAVSAINLVANDGEAGYTGRVLGLARAPNIATAALWVDALQQAGFAASVQRAISWVAWPANCCQTSACPEVWLTHDHEEASAKELLHSLQNMPQRRWLCRLRRDGGRAVSVRVLAGAARTCLRRPRRPPKRVWRVRLPGRRSCRASWPASAFFGFRNFQRTDQRVQIFGLHGFAARDFSMSFHRLTARQVAASRFWDRLGQHFPGTVEVLAERFAVRLELVQAHVQGVVGQHGAGVAAPCCAARWSRSGDAASGRSAALHAEGAAARWPRGRFRPRRFQSRWG